MQGENSSLINVPPHYPSGTSTMKHTTRVLLLALLSAAALQGCTIIAIADTVGTLAVKSAGVAADAAIGTAKVTVKAVSAVAEAAIPSGN
jgi:hypothetical protein